MVYSSFGLLSIIIHIIINIDILRKPAPGAYDPVKSSYRRFLWGVLIYYIVDVLWGSLYAWRLVVLTYIDTVMFFLMMVVSLFLWTRFIVAYLNRTGRFSRIILLSGTGILAFEVITLIINLSSPIVFYFDENKDYIPCPARYITLAMQIILFAMISIYTLYVSAKEKGKDQLHYRAMGFSGVCMTIFIILQTLDPFLPFYAVGCLIATCIIHTFVVADEREDSSRELGSFIQMAYKDALTRVKNRTAYLEKKNEIEELIAANEIEQFGVLVMDINDLKKINDTLGHDAGDRYITDASSMICKKFVHSPVYRIGGDEFAVIITGDDYDNRDALLASFEDQIETNLRKGDIVIASGMAVYSRGKDSSYEDVFERADWRMYERKKALKAM